MNGWFLVRVGLTLVILTYASLFILAALGYSEFLLRAMNVPTMRPFFADLRTIPSIEQLESLREVRIENPDDPWGRPFNYPEVWVYLIEPFRICSDPFFCVGSLQFAIYLTLVTSLVWRVESQLSAVTVMVLAISPPVTLLLERGNTDGFTFLLVLFAVIWQRPFQSPFLIALASCLKLFPAAALPIVFKVNNAAAFALALVLASPLLVATFTDFWAIHGATPISDRISFGIPSFAKLLGTLATTFTGKQFSSGTLLLASVSTFFFAVLLPYFLFRQAYQRLHRALSMSPGDSQILLVFGVIVISTFMVTSNWAYRIVFLGPIAFLSVRWLFEQRTANTHDLLLLIILNVAIFGAFWSFLGPYGHLLFNAVTFVAVALLFPLVAMGVYHHMTGNHLDETKKHVSLQRR